MNRPVIIWVDSDENLSPVSLRKANYHVVTFNETADALKYLSNDGNCGNVVCIITSMMERGGRKERGLLNGLQMIDRIRIIWKE